MMEKKALNHYVWLANHHVQSACVKKDFIGNQEFVINLKFDKILFYQ